MVRNILNFRFYSHISCMSYYIIIERFSIMRVQWDLNPQSLTLETNTQSFSQTAQFDQCG